MKLIVNVNNHDKVTQVCAADYDIDTVIEEYYQGFCLRVGVQWVDEGCYSTDEEEDTEVYCLYISTKEPPHWFELTDYIPLDELTQHLSNFDIEVCERRAEL